MRQFVSGGLSQKTTVEEIIGRMKKYGIDPKKQLEIGMEIEKEHTTSRRIAKQIALDHLSEIPDYYTRLVKLEKEANRYWSDKE